MNCTVTDLLLAALYQPVFQSGVQGAGYLVMVIAGLMLLKVFQCSLLHLIALVVMGSVLGLF